MNLKHSHSVSSLDALELVNNIFLHRECNYIELGGVGCYMMPYYEDQNQIVNKINELIKEKGIQFLKKNVIGFGHLSITGAYQHSKIISSINKGGITSNLFNNTFKKTFSGHFHVHQIIKDNFIYVGSPLQFNFGDAGDPRGIIIYDSIDNSINYKINPHCNTFFKINEHEIPEVINNVSKYKNTYIKIMYKDQIRSQQHEEIKKQLLLNGILDVKKESIIETIVKKSKIQIENKQTMENVINQYLNHIKNNIDYNKSKTKNKEISTIFESKDKIDKIMEIGRGIIERVGKIQEEREIQTGPVFVADIHKITIKNFLGVQGTLELVMSQLSDGIWIIQGNNGAGKSTIIEAISWCQFGEFIRSDMKKDYAINEKADECNVILEFVNGYTINRSRKRNKTDVVKVFKKQEDGIDVQLHELEKGEIRNTQFAINQLLGIDHLSFSRSVILGQNIVNNFITGPLEQRRVIIEESLGLEKFNYYFDEAKQQRVKLETELDLVEKQLKEIQDQYTNYNNQLQTTQNLNGEEKIKVLMEQKNNIMEEYNNQVNQINLLNQQLHNELTQFSEIAKQDLLDSIQSAKNKQTTFSEVYKDLLQVEKILRSVVVDQLCPTCKQTITQLDVVSTQIHSIIQLLVIKLNKYIDSTNNISEVVSMLSLLLKSIDLNYNLQQILIIITKISSIINDNDKEKLKLEQQYQKHETNRFKFLEHDKLLLQYENTKEKNINVLDMQINNIQSLLSVQQQQGTQLKKQLQLYQSQIEDYSNKLPEKKLNYQIMKFWELSFDKKSKSSYGIATLRAYVLENTVNELNTIIDKYMQKLTDVSLPVTLTADLELKEDYGKRYHHNLVFHFM